MNTLPLAQPVHFYRGVSNRGRKGILVIRVGVTLFRFVSHCNARHWLVHTLKNTRGRGSIPSLQEEDQLSMEDDRQNPNPVPSERDVQQESPDPSHEGVSASQSDAADDTHSLFPIARDTTREQGESSQQSYVLGDFPCPGTPSPAWPGHKVTSVTSAPDLTAPSSPPPQSSGSAAVTQELVGTSLQVSRAGASEDVCVGRSENRQGVSAEDTHRGSAGSSRQESAENAHTGSAEDSINESAGNVQSANTENLGYLQSGSVECLQSGCAETQTQGGSAETQSESAETQSGSAETQSGSTETQTQSGSAETQTQNGSVETQTQNGSAETQNESGSTETKTQSGSAETQTQSGSAETQNQSGSAETQNQSGSRSTRRVSAKKWNEGEPKASAPAPVLPTSTYEKIRLRCRSWRRPEGGLNVKMLTTYLRSLTFYLMKHPACTLLSLTAHYRLLFSPVDLRDLLQILSELGCVKLMMMRRQGNTCSLFTPRPSVHVSQGPDVLGASAEELVVEATVDCAHRLGQFFVFLQ